MQLNQRARDLIGAYSAALCQGYNVQQTDRYFSLTDPKETALRLALLEAVEFLNMITCADVDQLTDGWSRKAARSITSRRGQAMLPGCGQSCRKS